MVTVFLSWNLYYYRIDNISLFLKITRYKKIVSNLSYFTIKNVKIKIRNWRPPSLSELLLVLNNIGVNSLRLGGLQLIWYVSVTLELEVKII